MPSLFFGGGEGLSMSRCVQLMHSHPNMHDYSELDGLVHRDTTNPHIFHLSVLGRNCCMWITAHCNLLCLKGCRPVFQQKQNTFIRLSINSFHVIIPKHIQFHHIYKQIFIIQFSMIFHNYHFNFLGV